MTDQNPAVAALAEAMYLQLGDPFKSSIPDGTFELWARLALQAIQAQPELLREYGIGRLPTRKDLDNLPYKERGTSVTLGEFNIALMIEAGWCLPDPQPPEPTLPSVLGRIMYESAKPCLWEGASDYQKTLFIHQAEALLAEFDITPKGAAKAGRSQ